MNPVTPSLPGYVLGEVIGSGARGMVYRGQDESSGEAVAIKLLPPSSSTVSAGVTELSRAIALSHPHLVPFRNFFYLETGWTALIYEFLEGGSLRDHLEDGRALPLDQAARLLDQMLAGLEYLHQRGIIHCDVKPENFLLSLKCLASANLKLSDLGSAHWGAAPGGRGRRIEGSPAYMAPERFYQGFGCNSDLYSVGVIAYELLTGGRPFEGSVRELAHAHLYEDFDAAALAEHPLLPWLIMMLQKEPANRLENATEARRLLTACFEHKAPVTPSKSSHPPELPTNRAEQAHQAVSDLREFRLLAGLSFEAPPREVFLTDNARPQIILVFETHLEVVAAQGAGWLRSFLPRSGPALAPGPGGEIYLHTGQGLAAWKPDVRTSQAVTNACATPPLDLACSGNGRHLAWAEQRRLARWDLLKRTLATTPFSDSGLHPVVAAWNDGSFGATTGLMRNLLAIYHSDGRYLDSVALPGPALSGRCGGRYLFLLCLDSAREGGYQIAAIDAQGCLRQAALPLDFGAFTFTPGGCLFQDVEGRLHRFDPEDGIISVEGMPRSLISHISCSASGRYLLMVDAGDAPVNAQLLCRQNKP